MGGDLFGKFVKEVHEADDILGYSIKELCLDDPRMQLSNTQYTQPALYTVEALNFLDRIATGAKPKYCIGHSLGEYSALFAAGAFDFATGLKLVKKRGELMALATGGGMLAVINLPVERIMVLLNQHGLTAVDCANLNSPKQIVLSGAEADIAKANQILSGEAMMCVPLRVSGAFHSRYMQDAAHEFGRFLDEFEFKPLSIEVIANVTAKPYTQETIKENLTRQITSPVKWFESIGYLRKAGETEFVEVGPGNVLTRLLPQI